MKRLAAVLFTVSLFFAPVRGATPAALRQALDRFKSSKALECASVGFAAVTLGGDTLALLNGGTRLVPASNVKVITCGAALRTLGTDYRFKTEIAYSGRIADGILHGDLYIIGGGDPTTGSKYEGLSPADSLFALWKGMLDKAGIRAIDGTVIGDTRERNGSAAIAAPDSSVFAPALRDEGRVAPRDWGAEDMGFYYGAVPGALNFFGNALNISVAPGEAVGTPVKCRVDYPEAPWMVFSSSAVTGQRGTGDRLRYDAPAEAPFGRFSGSYAIDRRERIEECVNRFPEYTLAWYFHNYLQNNGIRVSKAFAEVSPSGRIRRDPLVYDDGDAAVEVSSLTLLGETFSPQLSDIAAIALQKSDNFLTEAILKALGRESGSGSSTDSSLVALRKILSGIDSPSGGKLPTDHVIQLRDGSGLSRTNYVSPVWYTDFLRAMAYEPCFNTYWACFPRPGEGTLIGRMQNAGFNVRRRVYMKSGSMNGIRCFTGYIFPESWSAYKAAAQAPGTEPDSKIIVFSLMINNATSTQSELCAATDSLLITLATL